MDEVDGMSSSDHGGIAELISYIRTSKIPIIFICNDRYTSKMQKLAKYCIDLQFVKLIYYHHLPQIQKKLHKIVTNEFPPDSKYDYDLHNKIVDDTIENGCGDIRQMIHLLQLLSNDGTNTNNKMLYNTDLTMGPWDVLSKLFDTQEELNISKAIGYVDYSLIPLLMHENYLNLTESTNFYSDMYWELWYLTGASFSIADSDLIDHNIRKLHHTDALPYHAVLSSIRPGNYLSQTNETEGMYTDEY